MKIISAAPQGADPCPVLDDGTGASWAWLALYGPSGGAPLASRPVAFPTSNAFETLEVPAPLADGTELDVYARCDYRYPRGTASFKMRIGHGLVNQEVVP